MTEIKNSKGQMTLEELMPVETKKKTTLKTSAKRRKMSEPASSGYSRRDFLKAGAVLTGSGILGLALGKLRVFDLFPSQNNPSVSNKETNLQTEMLGALPYTPDGDMSYYETGKSTRRYIFMGGDGNATYMLETDGRQSFRDYALSKKLTNKDFAKVYGPDINVEYRKYYAGISSVLQLDNSNPDHLLSIVHCENRISRDESASFTATVGLAESFDAGNTWTDKGPFIQGTDTHSPGGIDKNANPRVSGAGQPTAIFNPNDGYAYFAWVDWSFNQNHPDQIYEARAKSNGDGSLGELEYWTESGFSNQFDKNTLKPIIPVPQNSDFVYTALPSVSWNVDIKQYICTGECDTGFWMAKSSDLTDWSEPELIYDFTKWGGKPHSILKPGETWDSYPTILSEDQPNSHLTDKKGILYHSRGDNIVAHEPDAVSITIS